MQRTQADWMLLGAALVVTAVSCVGGLSAANKVPLAFPITSLSGSDTCPED